MDWKAVQTGTNARKFYYRTSSPHTPFVGLQNIDIN